MNKNALDKQGKKLSKLALFFTTFEPNKNLCV